MKDEAKAKGREVGEGKGRKEEGRREKRQTRKENSKATPTPGHADLSPRPSLLKERGRKADLRLDRHPNTL